MRRIGNFTAFFGADDVFSNWHPCRFEYHEVTFSCVEQFMMYAKAKLFSDEESACQILLTDDPRSHKALGRRVKGFDATIWEQRREGIVFVGCREKFSQNPALRSALLGTASTEMVEASPYDRIWGVGLGERDPRIADRNQWAGLNLLGIALMRVRHTLSTT